MTTGQISMLHNLCVQINLLAAKRDDAPVVIYTMVGEKYYDIEDTVICEDCIDNFAKIGEVNINEYF